MARSGLFKSEVKRARDTLLAQGKHPSLDAVRIELGNTGSKTTIHKYLKELEEEDGGAGGRTASISEALQSLVERLAAQLQEEANAKIDQIRAEAAEMERQHSEALAAAAQQATSLNDHIARLEGKLSESIASETEMRERLTRETIARHTAEQQVSDLKERLVENESHRRSLEEKHQHAREALEHYRTSVKEQREQDARRHEQQVQQLQAEIRTLRQSVVVKQEEVTRLNQEGARLVAELSHAKQTAYERESQIRDLQQKHEAARAVDERCRQLETQLIAQGEREQGLMTKLAAAEGDAQRLQGELTAANAKLEAQKLIVDEFRTHLVQTQSIRPSNTTD